MRILFFGGKNIGCGCLKHIIESRAEVVGVVTNPSDIEKDRWHESVAEIASNQNIPVFITQNINSAEGISYIKRQSPDIIFVVYFDEILKSEIIGIPPLGCINLHMALAEEYRGCYPTTWAILNGEKRTGVTLHYIDEGIDTGDIISQVKVPITEYDTGKSLYDKCTKAGIDLFHEQFQFIVDGVANRRKQATNSDSKYYKRDYPSREIDFSKDGERILTHIRAHLFEPFPPPFFSIGGKKYIIIEEK
jgi:methionyl-tRNA formyltransferase